MRSEKNRKDRKESGPLRSRRQTDEWEDIREGG